MKRSVADLLYKLEELKARRGLSMLHGLGCMVWSLDFRLRFLGAWRVSRFALRGSDVDPTFCKSNSSEAGWLGQHCFLCPMLVWAWHTE